MPGVLLAAVQALLGSFQQLQVLDLHTLWCNTREVSLVPQVVQWLEVSGAQVLPPRLLLLGLCSDTAEDASFRQLQRRLQRVLGTSGCEVVVGTDLEQLCHPFLRLAGLPAWLQQELE
jgi:hypothetical protein